MICSFIRLFETLLVFTLFNLVTFCFLNFCPSAQCCYLYTVGTDVELLSANGVLVGHGVVTGQTAVHGYELTYGWVPLMVKTIKTNVKPQAEFPTHSGEVEKDSFVAWPKAFLKRESFKKQDSYM